MAQQIGAGKNYHYKKFEVTRKHLLGRGSFGTVYKAKCDRLPCVAKVLHSTTSDLSDLSNEKKIQEVFNDKLKKISHPHLVQYLGFEKDPDTLQSVLLMEYLDENLTMLLLRDESNTLLPFYIQVDLAHDISLGLAYLHLNGIIHQNLSSNNVLVVAGRRAKVSDYGMTMLNPNASRPDCQISTYMPPEAFFRQSGNKITNKFDTFSLGALLIQICTRQLMEPGPALETVKDDRYPMGEIQVHVPEMERRKAQLSLINQDHPFLELITKCLVLNEADRLSSDDICNKLQGIKENHQYRDSKTGSYEVQILNTKEEELKNLLSEKEEELKRALEWVKMKDNKIKSLQTQMDEESKMNKSLIQDKNIVIKHREELLQSQITQREKMQDDFQRTIQNLSQEVESLTERLLWYRESESEDEEKDGIPENMYEPEKTSSPLSQNFSHHSSALQEQVQQSEHSSPHEHPTAYDTQTSPQPTKLPPHTLHRPWDTSVETPLQKDSFTLPQKQIEIKDIVKAPLIENEDMQQEQPFNPINYIGTPPESEDELSCHESDKIEMIMRDGENAPRAIMRGSSVVDGNTAYFSYGTAIYSYNSENEKWSILQTNALRFSSLEVVQGLLTTIGGRSSSTRETTDKLLSLVNELGTYKWVESFPPMPTKRCYVVTTTTKKELIVAGGTTTGQPENNTTLIEVMDVQSLTWNTAISLPMPITNGSFSICGDTVCIVGGKTIFTLPLKSFLNSFSTQKSLTSRLKRSLTMSLSLTPPPQEVWSRGADIPVHRTTCASVNGQLLAVGGVESEGKVSAAIYKYDRDLDCWEVITHMAVPRYNCHVGVLSSNELMVVGGCTRAHQLTSSVEIAQIL